MNENMIKVLNREGKVREGKVLLFCKDQKTEKMYISYTFDEKNDDNIIVLASVLKSNSDSYYMDVLEDGEWKNLIDTMKLTFNKDEDLNSRVYMLSVNDELSKDTIVVDRGHKTAAMREEIVIGLREAYVELIPEKPKKAEINDLTDGFGFTPFKDYGTGSLLSNEKYNVPTTPIEENTDGDDDSYQLPKYENSYKFDAKEEPKVDNSYQGLYQTSTPRYAEPEQPVKEEPVKSKYDVEPEEDDDKKGTIAYEKILETLQANNELLAAIKEALAREKK